MPEQGSAVSEHAKREWAARLWLSYYNRVLYEKGIITEQERSRMEQKISSWKLPLA